MFGRFDSHRISSRIILLAAVVGIIAACSLDEVADAQETPVIKLKQHVLMDDVGDAEVKLSVVLPTTELYNYVKLETPNIAVFLRELGIGRDWREFENVAVKFEDTANKVNVDYKIRGLGSTDDGSTWEVPLLGGAGLELVTVAGQKAIYQMAGGGSGGVYSALLTVEAPKGAEEVKSLTKPLRVSFRSTATRSEGSQDNLDFQIESKPQVMTCLAKSYSNPNFNYMWVARSRFQNAGDCTLSDFRVRYQIPGYTSWSSWARARRVVPGQTVMAPYFPIFDMEKVNVLTGSRPASLQIEYEYKTPTGETVKESDSRRFELLSPNHVLFSNLKPDEMVGWYDRFNIIEPVVASFVNGNDPVMQQLTGGISRMGGGLAAGADDEDALKFLEALYIFMNENNIAYQSPPGILKEGVFGQHIKYGRDVLRNRSATCIDYAVLVASACEAAGMRSAIVVLPGHAFPVIYLPESGRQIPLEATVVGKGDYETAVGAGFKSWERAQEGPHLVIDVKNARDGGVQSLDLPKTTVTFIKDLDYKFRTITWIGEEGDGNNTPADDTPAKIDHPSVGHWLFSGNVNGRRLYLESWLSEDGSYKGYQRISGDGIPETEALEKGSWAVSGDSMVVADSTGKAIKRKFYMKEGKLYVFFSELGSYLGFRRQ